MSRGLIKCLDGNSEASPVATYHSVDPEVFVPVHLIEHVLEILVRDGLVLPRPLDAPAGLHDVSDDCQELLQLHVCVRSLTGD